jgi:hypothetical protein
MIIQGRRLGGDGQRDYPDTDLTIETMKEREDYKKLLKRMLCTGFGWNDTTYIRTTVFNSIKKCDANVNGKDYTARPWARVLTKAENEIIDSKKTRGKKRTASGKAARKTSNSKKNNTKARTKSKKHVEESEIEDDGCADQEACESNTF